MGRLREILATTRVLATRAIALLAVIGAAAPPGWAGSCDLGHAPAVPVVKGLAYAQARQAILAGGWQPVAGHPHNDLSSNEVTFRDRGYTELQFCRLSADSLCRFKFGSGSFTLWVTSTGDDNTLLDSQAIVKVVRLTCADEADPN